MDLNNIETIRQLDPEDMIEHINKLPQQLLDAWETAKRFDLPKWQGIDIVLISGLGGSAIGGDLVAAYVRATCQAPVIVLRDYNLPAWVKGENVLVVCSSHSGNTEETVSVLEQARQTQCRILAVTTGGKLANWAKLHGHPLWQFDYPSQPRAAVGYSFGLMLAVLARLQLIPDPEQDLKEAVAAMQAQQESLLIEVKDTQNPAKRLAGQLVGRWVTIFGSGILAPVARRWKCQINENAKAHAAYEILPEADHNTLQGTAEPQGLFGSTMNIFLRAAANHERNKLRGEFTRREFMLQGYNTDFYTGQGEGPLAQMWTALHFGDYVSYYLAIAYGVDPTPVPLLADLKAKMKLAGK
jgi:glucose/mannose-6-phosphate isomerase